MIVTGPRASLAMKHKLGTIVNVIPPKADITEEENALLDDEVKEMINKSHESRRRNEASKRQVEEMREQIASLTKVVATLAAGAAHSGAPNPVCDPLGVGAIWWAAYGERQGEGRLIEASENLFMIEEDEATRVKVVHISNGQRVAHIRKETLLKNPKRYVCIRPAGAKTFTFPEKE